MQTGLRYTAEGSSARNDMKIAPNSFSSPLGGDPLEGEGVRLNVILELPLGSGELSLTSNDTDTQPHLDYRFLVEHSGTGNGYGRAYACASGY